MTGVRRSTGALPALAVAAAWSPYLPLGWQYAAFLSVGLAALVALGRAGRLGTVARHPVFLSALALWIWLAATAAWTRAPAHAVVAHLWTYSLLLWVTPIALAIAPADGRRALRHFVAASVMVAAAVLIDASGWLPATLTWRPFVGVTGNQRIAFSLLLALGGTLAVLSALEAITIRSRVLAAAAALLCLAGLTLQDRRTGMLAAPLLLAVLALARQRSSMRRLALLALIAAAAGLTWLASDHVRQRFDEGMAELHAYRSDGEVSTSWGMRARMLEVTGRLVLERPLAGHGIGSWVTEWRQRVAGSVALEANTTPHSEYLLLAMQGGAVALLLALLLWLCALRGIIRRGPPAQPPLLVLAALTWAACFNVVLRDAKFALPLLGLSALAWAASRPTPSDGHRSGVTRRKSAGPPG